MRTTSLRALALIAVLAVPATALAPAGAQEAPSDGWGPGRGWVEARYVPLARHHGGWVGAVQVTDPSPDLVRRWWVEFSLPAGTRLHAVANAWVRPVGPDRYRLTPLPWNTWLRPGGTTWIGLAGRGRGGPSDLSWWPSRPTPPTTSTTSTSTTSTSTTSTSTTSTSTTSTSTTSTSTTLPPLGPVVPVLSCVSPSGGSVAAQWGWSNSAGPTELPVGPSNSFAPAPADRGQSTSFAAGTTPAWPTNPFAVPFDGNPLAWNLDGHEVVASRASTPCTVSVALDLSWVDADGNPIAPPSGAGRVVIAARSDLGTATCQGAGGAVDCTYDNQPGESDDGLAVADGSSFDVVADQLPDGVTVVSGDGSVPVPGEGCGTTTRDCTHPVVLRWTPTPTTTSSSTTSSSTTLPTTTSSSTTSSSTTLPTTTSSSTTSSSTTLPTTTSSSTTSSSTTLPTTTLPTTTLPTTTLPTTTLPTTTLPTTTLPTTTLPTTTAAPAARVLAENTSGRTQDLVLVCERPGSRAPTTTRLRLAAGAGTAVRGVARGAYCSLFAADGAGDDSMVVPWANGVAGAEDDGLWSYGGAWLCGDELRFSVVTVTGPTPLQAPAGARPARGCDEPVALTTTGPAGRPWWPFLVIVAVVAGLGGWYLARDRRDRRVSPTR